MCSSPQLHGDHSILFPILNIGAVQSDFLQVEVTPDAKTTDYVVDDDVHLRLRFLLDLLLAGVQGPGLLFGLQGWHRYWNTIAVSRGYS